LGCNRDESSGWIGSEIASMAGHAGHGSLGQFVAELIGSIIVLVGWQALSGRSGTPPRP
jgi:uncharacterized membrane protein YeaQ/YmgE (transglycosylase-associated protein family)